MSDGKLPTLWPISMGEVKRIHDDTRGPIGSDEAAIPRAERSPRSISECSARVRVPKAMMLVR